MLLKSTDLSVPTEAKHDVVNLILEHEVIIIVGGSQLDVLDDELVEHDVHRDHRLLQLIVVHLVLL